MTDVDVVVQDSTAIGCTRCGYYTRTNATRRRQAAADVVDLVTRPTVVPDLDTAGDSLHAA